MAEFNFSTFKIAYKIGLAAGLPVGEKIFKVGDGSDSWLEIMVSDEIVLRGGESSPSNASLYEPQARRFMDELTTDLFPLGIVIDLDKLSQNLIR